MQRRSEEVVRDLRQRATSERAALEDLLEKFTDPSTKDRVQRALFDLDDVGAVLPMIESEAQTPLSQGLAIRTADLYLQSAVSKRTHFQSVLEECGADVRLIP